MKKITLLTVFIITSLFSMSSNAQSNEKSLTAIYKGMTVSDNFKFFTSLDVILLFNKKGMPLSSAKVLKSLEVFLYSGASFDVIIKAILNPFFSSNSIELYNHSFLPITPILFINCLELG